MNGIYAWKNIQNGKMYIGQTKYIVDRPYDHFKCSTSHGQKFENAIKKYGKKSFKLIILDKNVSNLNIMEKHYIRVYSSYINGYNSTLGGNGIYPDIIECPHNILWNCRYTHIVNNTNYNRKKMFRLYYGNYYVPIGYFIDPITTDIIGKLISNFCDSDTNQYT
jgi:group I intron endonuclease